MNKPIQITHDETHRSSRKARLIVVLGTALGGFTGQTFAADDAPSDYDANVLLNPSEAVLLAEARGRVTIYDGLEHSVIDRALDNQFERMDNMMFIRTRETLPDGSVDVDDDC